VDPSKRETTRAPGATPLKRPFSPRLATTAPVTIVLCPYMAGFSAMKRSAFAVCTTSGIVSRTGVSGSSWPSSA
jgi:hypothetical protein